MTGARGRSIRAVPTPAGPPALLPAVERAVAALTALQPEDAAIRELALRYAATIDAADELAEAAAAVPYDPATAAQVAKLRQRVEAHVVMVEVGPKLAAALDALQATPRARAQVAKPAPAGKASKLHQLRAGGAS